MARKTVTLTRCTEGGTQHRFEGYPRDKAVCKWCGKTRK